MKIALISLTLALAASPAAPTAMPLPPQVLNIVNDMKAVCRAAGGQPGASPGLVLSADLNGDGRVDHVIDEAAFDCEGAASLFTGAGGGHMQVFVTAADGNAALAFEHGADGLRVEGGALWLAVGGPLCGQQVTDNMSHSAMQACWRPLQWLAAQRRFDFAPLSRVKPYR
ncbi:hypothetical protein [Pelomonas cellulosilytica]|uniref:Uncharacterized protein n=1 Tax=Pelomonas cellulosilytica TaxID=2906762 RepID=A0ABS8Y163_9BURK|nr:hypothetical protein [Pelomonas sp. P8]MCE4556693.1 hypothetical protein [Pelomonas sp. P8]